jgi:hypothetical protein
MNTTVQSNHNTDITLCIRIFFFAFIKDWHLKYCALFWEIDKPQKHVRAFMNLAEVHNSSTWTADVYVGRIAERQEGNMVEWHL